MSNNSVACSTCGLPHYDDCSIDRLNYLIRKIHSEIYANLQHIDLLKARANTLERKLGELTEGWQESMRLREINKARPCVICGKRTTEKFGERTQCYRHTSKDSMEVSGRKIQLTDEMVRSAAKVLDDFLHGD